MELQENTFISKLQYSANCAQMVIKQFEMLMLAAYTYVKECEDPKRYKQKLEENSDTLPMIPKIIRKRIEVMQLPINFTISGLIAIDALACGNPGKAIAILIDCLTSFEGNLAVSADDLINKIYPNGFYSDDVFIDYVDNYIKQRKVKWAEIY